MWFRKTSPRRQAIREDAAEAKSLAQPVPRQAGHIFVIAAVFVLVAIAIQFWPHDPLPYHVGERAPVDLRSPTDFTIVNPTQTERLRDATREMTPPVLVADRTVFDSLYGQLNNLKYNVEGAHSLNDVAGTVKQHFPGLTEDALHRIQALNANVFEADARTLVYRALPNIPLVTKEDYAQISERPAGQVALTPTATLPDAITEPSLQSVIVLGSIDETQRQKLSAAIAD